MIPLRIQLFSLLTTVGLGVLLGFCFDVYRAFGRGFRCAGPITSLTDFLFWLFIVVITFPTLVWVNGGIVREYVFIGMGFGLLIYSRWMSIYVRGALRHLLKILGKNFFR